MDADEVLQNAEHALEAGDTAREVARAHVERAERAGVLPELVGLLRSYDAGAADDLVVDHLLRDRRDGDGAWIEGREGGARLTSLAEVEAERVRWLWPTRVPLGKLTMLDGDPGVLKSTLALDLAARLSRAAAMPDGTEPDVDGSRGTVLLTAEDGLADTIRPRLDAAGADAARVVALQGVGTEEGDRLPTVDDLDALREAVEAVDAALIVVDPLVAYLGAEVNSYRDQDVRAALADLADLADEAGVAVLAIRHLNKSGGDNPLHRGGGSIGLIAAARSGLLVARDPKEPDGPRRIMAVTKANLAAEPPALAFRPRVVDGVVTLLWEGETEHAARDLLAVASKEERTAQEEAAEILWEELRRGPRRVEDLQDVADRLGVSWKTVSRAATSLDVKRSKVGFGEDGYWVWSLPSPRSSEHAVSLGGEDPAESGSSRDVFYSDRGDVSLGNRGDGSASLDAYPDKGSVLLEDGPEGRGSSEGKDPYEDSPSETEGGEVDLQTDLGAALDGGEEVP